MFKCAYCEAVLITFNRYSKHLRQYHETMPNFHVTCKIDGCIDVFTTVRYFVRHVNKKHRNMQALDDTAELDCVDVECTDTHCNVADIDDSGEVEGDRILDHSSLEVIVSNFEERVAQCILKLREKHILSVVQQEDMIDEMQLLVFQVHDTYKSMFTTFCPEQSVSFGASSSGMGQFLNCDDSIFANAFKTMDTDYKLNKYISDNFVNVKPIEILFSQGLPGKPSKFSYVSIGSVLN